MGPIVLRILLLLVGLVVAGVIWVASARPLSLLLDRLGTVEIETRPVAEVGLEDIGGGMLRIDNVLFNTAAPDNQPSPLRMSRNPRRQLVVERMAADSPSEQRTR